MKQRCGIPRPTRPSSARATASPTRCSCRRSEPEAGVVILHGAGSAKESHFDFAARLPRRRAWPRSPTTRAATAARRASFGPGAIDDVLAMFELLRAARAARRAARLEHGRLPGDPRGGARSAELAPWWRSARRRRTILLRGLRSDEQIGVRVRPRGARAVARVARTSTRRPAGSGPSTALLLLHARGDEQVPYTRQRGAATRRAREPKRLLVLPGGHHRSLQHDLELQAVSPRSSATRPAPPAVLRIILVRLSRCRRRSTWPSCRSCARRSSSWCCSRSRAGCSAPGSCCAGSPSSRTRSARRPSRASWRPTRPASARRWPGSRSRSATRAASSAPGARRREPGEATALLLVAALAGGRGARQRRVRVGRARSTGCCSARCSASTRPTSCSRPASSRCWPPPPRWRSAGPGPRSAFDPDGAPALGLPAGARRPAAARARRGGGRGGDPRGRRAARDRDLRAARRGRAAGDRERPRRCSPGALALALAEGVVGLYLAYWLDLPPGPPVAVLGALVYLAAAALGAEERRGERVRASRRGRWRPATAASRSLRDVSFAPRAGQTVCVLGPNGGGKTTLFRVLLGELEPLSGRVRAGRPARLRGADRAHAARLPGERARRGADGHARARALVAAAAARRARRRPRGARARRPRRRRRTPASASSPAASASARCSPARSCRTRRCCCSTSRSPASTPPAPTLIDALFDELRAEGRTLLVSSHDVESARALRPRALPQPAARSPSARPAETLDRATLEATYGQRADRARGRRGRAR